MRATVWSAASAREDGTRVPAFKRPSRTAARKYSTIWSCRDRGAPRSRARLFQSGEIGRKAMGGPPITGLIINPRPELPGDPVGDDTVGRTLGASHGQRSSAAGFHADREDPGQAAARARSLRPRNRLRHPRRGLHLPRRLHHRRSALRDADLLLARGRPRLLARLVGEPPAPHDLEAHQGLPYPSPPARPLPRPLALP